MSIYSYISFNGNTNFIIFTDMDPKLKRNVQVLVRDLKDVVGIEKAKEQFEQEASQTKQGTSSGVQGEGFVPQHLLDAFAEEDEEQGKISFTTLFSNLLQIIPSHNNNNLFHF